MGDNAEIDGAAGGGRSLLATAAWAVGSFAAFATVVVWAYGLGARDPADVPAMTAGGAWRERPAEAGGREIPGQDAQVYGRFGAAPAQSTADAQLQNGVERPTEADIAAAEARAAGDIPSDLVLSMVRERAETPEAAERAEVIDLGLETAQPEQSTEPPVARRPTMPPNIGAGAPTETPPPNAATAPRRAPAAVDLAATTEQGAELATADAPAASAARSAASGPIAAPSPQRRPEGAAAAPARLPNPAESVAAVAPAPGPGQYQVQLAALPSSAAVEKRWAELRASAPQLLGAYSLAIEPVEKAGARLYRLRVGAFDQREDAAKLCNQLRAVGIDCYAARS